MFVCEIKKRRTEKKKMVLVLKSTAVHRQRGIEKLQHGRFRDALDATRRPIGTELLARETYWYARGSHMLRAREHGAIRPDLQLGHGDVRSER